MGLTGIYSVLFSFSNKVQLFLPQSVVGIVSFSVNDFMQKMQIIALCVCEFFAIFPSVFISFLLINFNESTSDTSLSSAMRQFAHVEVIGFVGL